MVKVVQITSGPYFRETLRDYSTIFAMFYISDHISAKVMLPIYESLCDEHSSPSVAFVKVDKEGLPGLCTEHDIPRDTNLTFAAFKNNDSVEIVEGQSSRGLERFVERNIGCVRVQATSRADSECFCGYNRAAEEAQSHPNNSGDVAVPSRLEANPPRVRTHRVPLHITSPCFHGRSRHRSYPAELRYMHHHRSQSTECPAHIFYRGQAGHYHRADDVRIQQGSDGRPEATYLDQSGPIAIERTLGSP